MSNTMGTMKEAGVPLATNTNTLGQLQPAGRGRGGIPAQALSDGVGIGIRRAIHLVIGMGLMGRKNMNMTMIMRLPGKKVDVKTTRSKRKDVATRVSGRASTNYYYYDYGVHGCLDKYQCICVINRGTRIPSDDLPICPTTWEPVQSAYI